MPSSPEILFSWLCRWWHMATGWRRVTVADKGTPVQLQITDLNRRPQFCRIGFIRLGRSHWGTALNWRLFAGTR